MRFIAKNKNIHNIGSIGVCCCRPPAKRALWAITWLLVSGLLLTISLVPLPAAAGTRSIEAIGTVHIQGDDLAVARDNALKAAQLAAFDRLVQDLVPAQTLATKFQTVVGRVYVNYDRFVQSYRVLAELRSGNLYRVLAQVDLQGDAIEGLLVAAGLVGDDAAPTLPSILVMAAELPPEEVLLRYWWHADLMLTGTRSAALWNSVLTAAGLRVITVDPNWRKDMPADLRPVLEAIGHQSLPDAAAAAALGHHFGAETLLLGKTTLQAVPPSGPRLFKAEADYRIIGTSDGRVLATAARSAESSSATANAGAGLLEEIIKDTAQTLLPQLEAGWQPVTHTPSGQVEIVLEGIQRVGAYIEFRRRLTLTDGITEVNIRELGTDRAILSVISTYSGQALAEALKAMPFTGFEIDSIDIRPEGLRVRLRLQ